LDSIVMRVALVEDDLVLRDRILVPNLRRFGFDVHPMALAADLRHGLRSGAFDIAVIDVGLPDGDGFTLARDCRASHPGMGIVMLTGRSQDSDTVRGLTEGADAYLKKPVSVDVLVATLHSLGRRLLGRIRSDQPWKLTSGDWVLRSPAGIAVNLTASERKLLVAMFGSADTIVQRETLIGVMTAHVHDYDPHRIDSLIHRLRRKVAAATQETLPLNAVSGEGYVLTPANS
jgi:DNA-binding response OmpR family regulator